jgi:hypothetical protein
VFSSPVVLASALPTVLFVGMVLAGVVAVMSLAARTDIYDEIGRGPLSMDRDDAAARDGGADAGADDPDGSGAAAEEAERELEIRQMLEARSARIVRAGGEPLDFEAELAKLAPPRAGAEPHDTHAQQAREQRERELEIRQMLEARSARIVRAGGEPLDVDAELGRLLGEGPHAPNGDDRAARAAEEHGRGADRDGGG